MFSNSNNSLPPTYSQSNTAAARDSGNRARYDVSPLTRNRLRRADIDIVDPDSPGIQTIRDRANNIVFRLTPRKDQDADIKTPPSSDGSAFFTVAVCFLALFLMWALTMVILQHGEQEQNTRELIFLQRELILQNGQRDQKTRELIDRFLQIFQEQQLESHGHRD